MEPLTVQAKFIGREGSLGLHNGRYYHFIFYIEDGEIVIEIKWGLDITDPVMCFYDKLSGFLKNWEVKE